MSSIRSNVRTAGSGGGGAGGSLGVVADFAAASGGTTEIDITLTDSADESYYILELSTDAGSTYSRLTTLAGGTTAYTHTGRSPSTTYHYRITAFDNLNVSSAWAEANATTDDAAAPQTNLIGHWNGDSFDAGDDEWDGVNTPADRFLKTAGSSASVVSNWQSSGQPAISFPTGATYGVQLPSAYEGFAPGTATSVRGSLYVVYSSDVTSGNRVILRFQDASNTASRMQFQLDTNDDMNWVSDAGVGAGVLNMGATTDGAITVCGGTRGDQAGTTVLTNVNAAADVSGSVDATGSDASGLDNLVIGADGLAVTVAEVLAYHGNSTSLNEAHHDSVMLYLNTKYGIV